MTKEQLLIPRVMVIGTEQGKMNYPGSNFRTGEVLQMYGRWYERENKSPYVSIKASDVAKFPNCFKPLPWWYGRKPEEMPDWVYYISMKGIKEVRKVIHWEFFEGHWMWKSECGEVGNFFYYKDDEQYQPATEQEYLDYIKQKEG